jgi:hypothetical protein
MAAEYGGKRIKILAEPDHNITGSKIFRAKAGI